MKILDVISAVLVLIGALNWGLIGIFEFNLVEFIFRDAGFDRIVYIIVGLAAVWEIFTVKGIRSRWSS